MERKIKRKRKKQPKTVFKEALKERYGDDIIDDFLLTKNDNHYTLLALAKKYNITDSYVSTLFRKLFGVSYSESRRGVSTSDTKYVNEKLRTKRIIFTVHEELYNNIAIQAARRGTHMSTIVRECVERIYGKEGWENASNIFI